MIRLNYGTAEIGDDDANDSRLGEPAEACLALAQCLLGLAARGPFLGFAQLALDRRGQANEFVFENVVVRSGAHRRPRGLFTNRSRDDDERHVGLHLFQDGKCRKRAEFWH